MPASTPSIAEKSTPSGAWVWFCLPLLVRRVFPSLSLSFTDGIYLAALGQLGAFLPFLALFFGFLLSGFMLMPGEIYSASLFVVGALIVVSGLGSALGIWLLLGYMVGDIIILRYVRVEDATQKFGQQGWRDVACVLVLYAILSMLLVGVPALATRLRQVTLLLPQQLWAIYVELQPSAAKKNSANSSAEKVTDFSLKNQRLLTFPFDLVLQVVFSGLLVYFWAQSAAVMMRSAFVWYRYPDVISTSVEERFVGPLQYQYIPLVYAACSAAVARIALEYFATSKPDFIAHVDALTDAFLNSGQRGAGFRSWTGEIIRIVGLIILLFGILMTPFYVGVTAAALLLSLLLRKAILPRMKFWAKLMWFIPLIVRLLAAGIVTYGLSVLMLGDYLNASDFYPVLRPLWISMVLTALLFPDEPRNRVNDTQTERGREN